MAVITTEVLLDALALISSGKDPRDVEIIDDLIEIYTNDQKSNSALEDGLTRKFISILNTMKTTQNDEKGARDRKALLLGFFSDPIIKNDELTYRTMRELFDSVENAPEKVQESIVEDIRRKLKNNILWNRTNKYVRRMYGKLNSCNLTTDIEEQERNINDVIMMARDLTDVAKDTDRLAKGSVERIDMSNLDSIKKAVERYKSRKVNGILHTGLQGLDRLTGHRRGLARGESVCIYALLHNFKSGLLMTIARGIICYNDPPVDCCGKPAVLFISLENEANENMMWFYKTAYEGIYRKSSRDISEEEIIERVHDIYHRRGWALFIERWEGTKFGAQEFINLVESYIAQGYDIVAAFVDYASKMKKASGAGGKDRRDDLAISDLYNDMCTFTKTRGILFVTAHQLNREAMKLVASAGNNHVKKFSAAFAGNSIGASQEIDLEIFVHLETNHLGKKYLTAFRGKHRYVDDTPEAHKYFAQEFTEFGIVSDHDTEPAYITDIYAERTEDTTSDTLEFSALF